MAATGRSFRPRSSATRISATAAIWRLCRRRSSGKAILRGRSIGHKRTPALAYPARHSTFGLESRSLHEPLPVHVTTAVNPKVECRTAFDDLTRLYEDTARFGSFSRRQRGSWSANQHCGVETTGHISATDVFRQVDVPIIYSLSPPPGSRLPQLDLDAEAIDRID